MNADGTFPRYDAQRGVYEQVVREDATQDNGRLRVFTTPETKWVGTWSEFKAAGGVTSWDADQTKIVLSLPAPYKFGIRFDFGSPRED